jgi:hypothetical protein
MSHTMSLEYLAEELARRSSRASTSFLSPADPALRSHLVSRFDRPAGVGESFIADPVCESMFPWKPSDKTFADLKGNLLHPTTVAALASDFKPTDSPYAHQLASWRTLLEQPGKSIMVTSGTGSGKTECFLVPILDSLIRQAEKSGPLTGVQALFLYPLNALIDSQKTRLSSWCKPLKGAVRFGLYNGNTLQSVPQAEHKAQPEQALDRVTIRRAPPPLLVTNATMLEYMLVRPEDQPLLQASQGKLRWIVIDEAHTYLGSNAAEVSLLLRRVMHAFGVDSTLVRFIATSATIGKDPKTSQALQAYLANLGGIDAEQVVVLGGEREVPSLPPAGAPCSLSDVRDASEGDRYQKLVNFPAARELRAALKSSDALKLSDLKTRAGLPDLRTTLQLLDLCQRARWEGRSFLPVRMHFFHRTQVGLWCCVNPDCKGKLGDATLKKWGFGAVFTEHRVNCPHCASLVFELDLCRSCGEPHLEGIDADAKGEGAMVVPSAAVLGEDDDTQAEADDGNEDGESIALPSERRFLHRPFEQHRKLDPGEECRWLDRETGQLGKPGADMVDVHVLFTPRCLRCGARETDTFNPLQPARIGAPLFLRTAVPVLLEQSAPFSDPLEKPFEGRRTLTFTDSRQGSASFALSTQMESERNFIRGWLWHQLSVANPPPPGESVEELQTMVQALEKQGVASHIVAPYRQKLAKAQASEVPSLSWQEAATKLANSSTVKHVIKENWRARYAPVTADQVAHTLLMRELMRRPQRTNSVETLGIVALDYPGIATGLPSEAKQLGLSEKDWGSFLRLCLDHVVRNGWALHLDDADGGMIQRRWLGMRPRSYVLVAPDGQKTQAKSVFWPRPRMGNGQPSRMACLLARATKTTADDSRIAEALEAAWRAVRPVMSQVADGFVLDLVSKARIVGVRQAWWCPVTRRVLPVSVAGWSPYVQDGTKYGTCDAIEMPKVQFPFGNDPSGSAVGPEQVRAWLESDPVVQALRQMGVWGDLHDRFSYRPDVILTAEHSAQQSPRNLQRYTEEFKKGELNILSCSTTMEMGVDIGGLSTVAMNNAPPGPANFFQRAGRAGRRGESAAASLTMCKATPHGEAVFRQPTWPWTTPLAVPRVAINSQPIIRRHLAALTLGKYLAGLAAHRLTMGWFFLPPLPPEEGEAHALRYAAWLASPETAKAMTDPLKLLVARTPLQGQSPEKLLELVREDFVRVRDGWLAQYEAAAQELKVQLEMIKGQPNGSPAATAANAVVVRLRDEYLLTDLTQRCFLPVHGFPTGLAQFITSTRDSIQQAKDDGFYDHPSRRAFPTRDLPIAIREYAPGSARIIDGKVYRSAGVTLNWQIPPGEADVKEVQQFKHFWRCLTCGGDGVSLHWQQACGQCGAEKLYRRSFLAPAGFAVDFVAETTNDDSEQVFLPMQPPHVSGNGPWVALADPEVGAHRLTVEGRILHLNEGEQGYGYAICLACGRAAAEVSAPASKGEEQAPLPPELRDHYRLRGGKQKNADGRCIGNDSPWLINKRHYALGAEVTSSIFELRLRPVDGSIPSAAALGAVAIAFREAAAKRLGIEVRELNWAIVPAHGDEMPAIALFDAAAGGAGYAPQLPELVQELLDEAVKILDCKRGCDVACHACVLSFDTQHAVKDQRVDRKAGLALLSPELLAKLQPTPALMALLGPGSRLEARSLDAALDLELQEGSAREVRVFLHGDPANWSLLDWSLSDALFQWLALDLNVAYLLPSSSLAKLSEATRDYLHGLLSMNLVKVHAIDQSPASAVVEVGHTKHRVTFATSTPASRVAGADWGQECQVMRLRSAGELPALPGSPVPLSALVVKPSDKIAKVRRTKPDCDIAAYGNKIVSTLLPLAPDAKARLDAKQPIALIQYEDAYTASPLAVRVAVEIMRAVANGQKPTAIIRFENKYSPNAKVSEHDVPSHRLGTAGTELLKMLFGAGSSLIVVQRKTLDHMRTLKVRWDDGKIWQVDFDGGVGFELNTPTQLLNLAHEPVSTLVQRMQTSFVVRPPSDKYSAGTVRPQPIMISYKIE